jgi:hypothetical protein
VVLGQFEVMFTGSAGNPRKKKTGNGHKNQQKRPIYFNFNLTSKHVFLGREYWTVNFQDSINFSSTRRLHFTELLKIPETVIIFPKFCFKNVP